MCLDTESLRCYNVVGKPGAITSKVSMSDNSDRLAVGVRDEQHQRITTEGHDVIVSIF